ncbi:MAG: ATP-binding protein [candidate division WOR-3 bacterium]
MSNLLSSFLNKFTEVSKWKEFLELVSDFLNKENMGIKVKLKGFSFEVPFIYPEYKVIKSKNGIVEIYLKRDPDYDRKRKDLKIFVNFLEKVFKFMVSYNKEVENYNLMNLVLNTLPFPVFIIDTNFNLIFANKKTLSLLKTSSIKTKKYYELAHGGDIPSFCLLEEVLREKRVIKKNYYDWETKRYFEIVHYPVMKNDKVEKIICTLQDITDVLENQKTLEMTSRMVFLGEMVSAFAHEINNPISAISGLSELISIEESIPEKIREYAINIKKAAERSSQIIRSILSFAREGLKDKEKNIFEINESIREILSFMSVFIEKEGIKLEFIPNDDFLYIYGNKNLFQQVILNLLLNSRDAIVEKGEKGNIWIRTYKEGEDIFVEVEDTGKGIPPELKNEIFLPFFTTKRPGKGTGLGLTLVKKIVEDHEGEISFDSQVGKGTVFKIKFKEFEKKPIQVQYREKEFNKKSYRILICDDEKIVLEFLKAGFEALGHKVDIVQNPLNFFDFVNNYKYDFIILDFYMPLKRGDELYEELISKYPEYQDKVSFITGFIADEEIEKKIKKLGVPIYFKPLTYADLPIIISQFEKI